MKSTTLLQIAMVWQGRILAYRLIAPGQKVTVGPSPDTTFTTPPPAGRTNASSCWRPSGNHGGASACA